MKERKTVFGRVSPNNKTPMKRKSSTNANQKITFYFDAKKRSHISKTKLQQVVSSCDTAKLSPLKRRPLATKQLCAVSRNLFRSPSPTTHSSIPGGPTSLGIFEKFSPELRWTIFHNFPLWKLGVLSVSSRTMRDHVEGYIFSEDGRKRFQHDCRLPLIPMLLANGYVIAPPAFNEWGRLLKNVTCLYSTHQRIQIVRKFFAVHNTWCEMDKLNANDNDYLSRETIFRGWGELFAEVLNGWAFSEFDRVFTAIMSFGNSAAYKIMLKVLQLPHDQNPHYEMMLRLCLNSVFVTPYDGVWCDREETDRAFWLSRLLKGPYPPENSLLEPTQRGKLFFLIFGPKDRQKPGHLHWNKMCATVVRDREEALNTIGKFSTPLEVLCAIQAKIPNSWTVREIFSLIEELTTCPAPWAFDNFAALLLFGPRVAEIALRLRLVKEKSHEVATILNIMKNLAFRWNMMGTFIKILKATFRYQTAVKKRMFDRLLTTVNVDRLQELSSQPQSPQIRRDFHEEYDAHLVMKKYTKPIFYP